ncbi:helix-turn-helix domain-containing protein [Streptomyces sp. NPDC055078]
MDTQNLSAPAPAPYGVTHANTRHTTRFTVIGNHLAQHTELSLLAIGLAVHIQSLPTGARVDIKTLAARFPEGADRIAGALRETDPRLLLSARDTERLTPGVAAWLEREASPDSVSLALTAGLPPEALRHPAAFLAHRLTARLPPPPPFRKPPEAHLPLQNCDRCDRAFRAPEPGACRGCRSTSHP